MSTSSRVSDRAGTGRARPDHHAARRGFAFTDAAVLLAAIALAGSLALPTLHAWRTDARLAGSRDNLRQLGQAHAAYSDANEGFIAGFSLQAGEEIDLYPPGTVRSRSSALEAQQFEAAAIIRQITGRFGARDNQIIPNLDRVPHRRYSHLPLLHWMGASATDPLVVSPLDTHQQTFQAYTEPEDYPALPGGDPDSSFGNWTDETTVEYWPYASSYQTTPYAFTPSRPDAFDVFAVEPSADGTMFNVQAANAFGRQLASSVRFPANKALLFEEFDYSQGLGNHGLYYADPLASVNILAFDGSAPRIATADANPGWDPDHFRDMEATPELRYSSIDTRYFPEDFGRPDPYPGYYKWTRGGLEGIDFGAGEINTSDW